MMHSGKTFRVLLLACCVAALSAQAGPPSFVTAVSVNDPRIQFKAFSGSVSQSLELPRRLISTSREDGVVYMLADLWRNHQWRGEWVNDKEGRNLFLAEVQIGPMEVRARGSMNTPASPASFKEAIQKFPAPTNKVELTALAEWIGVYFGGQCTVRPRKSVLAESVAWVQGFDIAVNEQVSLAYAFSMKQNTGINPSRVFVFGIGSAGTDRDTLAVAVERSLVPSIRPKGGSGGIKQDHSTMTKTGRASDGDGTDSVEGVRDMAIKSIQGQSGWWHMSSRNYILLTDVHSSGKQFVSDLLDELETLHSLMRKILPHDSKLSMVGTVRVFDKKKDYNDYAGPLGGRSIGMWDPSKSELILASTQERGGRLSTDELRDVMYHEAMHQYVSFVYRNRSVPVWYNEGVACFVSGATKRGKEWIIEEPADIARTVDRLVATKRIDFREVMGMDYGGFYDAPGAEELCERYATVWALVYYLAKDAEPGKSGIPADIISSMHRSLLGGKAGDGRSVEKILAGIDLDALTSDFIRFWKSTSRRSDARRNNPYRDAVTK